MGRRVLVTGLATFWGSRVAQVLEADPDVDVIIGLDRENPTVQLERTEFVRTDEEYSILARIVRAARIDTIVHTFLVVDSTLMRADRMHEINVIGTMNLFAAAAAGSTVRDVVVKSSTLVYGSNRRDPNWFTEDHTRTEPPRTAVERSVLEVEGYVRDFATDNPHVNVTLLRFSNVLGPDITTPLSRALTAPLVPSIAGFDPRMQFVHEDDVIAAIEFVLRRRLAGIYNVAGDGLVPWSEIVAICGRRRLPLPFVAPDLAAAALAPFGIRLPPEALELLRYGRGVDNRRLKQAGFVYRYTTAGAVRAFAEAKRLEAIVGTPKPEYTYDPDVEAFFRHSPAVVGDEPAD